MIQIFQLRDFKLVFSYTQNAICVWATTAPGGNEQVNLLPKPSPSLAALTSPCVRLQSSLQEPIRRPVLPKSGRKVDEQHNGGGILRKNMTLASDQKLNNEGLSATSRRLLELRETVFTVWEQRVRASLDKARNLPHPVLIDTLPAFYDNIVEALTLDYPRLEATEGTNVASEHGGERARVTTYDYEALIDEYQLFRRVIFETLHDDGLLLTPHEMLVINTSIDAGIKKAVAGFSMADRVLRERFAAALAHDLRGPLGNMSAALELTLISNDVAKTRMFTTKALDNVYRMNGMIDELLHTMASHAGEKVLLRLSNFDICELIKEVRIESAVKVAQDIVIDSPGINGWWDRAAMKRALENLVNNGVKYGTEHGTISISARATHGRLMLSVHNEGEPIALDEHDSIFHMFKRAKNSELTRHKGWGIGLPYVRTVAESHGGSIVVDSTAERGTTFMIDVPVDCRPFSD